MNMKKIVIIPSFASWHHLKCWIPNMISTINPDEIIINESLFPQGPENKGHVDSNEFKKKWCHPNYPNCGFDYDSTKLLELLESYYIDNETGESKFNKLKVVWQPIQYSSSNAVECYKQAISNFDPEVGSIIYCLEPDAFIFEGDIDIINSEVDILQVGEGLACKWLDFLETNYYTEAINLVQPKVRRFCYKFDNMENYLAAMGDGFMTQSYPKLKKVDSFFIRHYCWFLPEKYKQLRYQLIHRTDPQYWLDFDNGLNEIREYSQRITHPNYMPSVEIRPSRQDEGRWAKFIDIPHPKAIMNHENFVK